MPVIPNKADAGIHDGRTRGWLRLTERVERVERAFSVEALPVANHTVRDKQKELRDGAVDLWLHPRQMARANCQQVPAGVRYLRERRHGGDLVLSLRPQA